MASRFILRILLWWAAAMSVCFAGNYSFQKIHTDVRLDASQRAERIDEWVIAADNQAGVMQIAQFPLVYVQDLQELEIISAATVMPDGTEIPIDFEKQVFDRPLPVAVRAPVFSQARVKVMVFPGLVIGGKIHFKYRWREKEALFPGYFSMPMIFPRSEAFADVSIKVTVPDTVLLEYKNIDMPPAEIKRENGMQVLSWRYAAAAQPEPPVAPEFASIDSAPRLLMGSYLSWKTFAEQYRVRAEGKVTVDESIQTLADEITRGTSNRREQARQLYDWVNQNIRFVGVHLGAGPVVPHPAPDVLKNRYGDCKDHVVLLEALLKAKGIASSAALINSGNAYTLQPLPVSAQFNHLITYLPELDLFVDSTAPFAAFGELAFALGGKPALLVSDGSIKYLPAHNSSTASVIFDASLKFDAAGNAEGRAQRTATGDEALQSRTGFALREKSELARNALLRTRLTGTLAYAADDTRQLNSPFTNSWTGRFERMLDPEAPFFVPPMLPGASDFSVVQRNIDAKLAKGEDWLCDGNLQHVRYTLAFPAGRKVSELPPNVDAQAGAMRYTARYTLKDNVVTIERVLERMQTSNVCTAKQAAEWQPVARAIEKDLRQAVFFSKQAS